MYIAFFAVSTSLTLAGRLCPTCPATSGATRAATPPATGEGEVGAPAALARGKRLVIWDGARIRPRNVGVGRSGRLDFWDGGESWAACDSKPKCKAAFAATPSAGVDGSKGLKFHAEGSGWIGSGWSWFGWYPATAGTDLSSYGSLTFQIRVEAKSPDASPEPSNVAVLLVCSNGKKSSARAMVQKYDASFDDGRWHKIMIPVTEFTNGKDGAEFDPKTAWELRLSTWSATPRDFNIYIDQIAAEK